jgi:tetratricopeptide (TPR) repeat protein
MRRFLLLVIIGLVTVCVRPLAAQQPCPGFPGVPIGSAEDYLIQYIFEAEGLEERIEILDEYVEDNPESKFLPCVEEYYALYYLQLQNNDKVIEHGEKAAESGKAGFLLYLNLTKAYVGKGGPAERATEVALICAEQLNQLWNRPAASEEEQATLRENLIPSRSYLEYAYFQMVPRIQDVNQRIQFLDQFPERFPESTLQGQLNLQYFAAYKVANDEPKVIEHGEKAVAANPDDVVTLNLVAEDYANRGKNLEKATEYAKKVLELAPSMERPAHISEDRWEGVKSAQLGLAHESLGYIQFREGLPRKRFAPAVAEFKTAIELLTGDPFRQARARFRLGYTYAAMPATSGLKQAESVLQELAATSSPWQAPAQDILSKVRTELKKRAAAR